MQVRSEKEVLAEELEFANSELIAMERAMSCVNNARAQLADSLLEAQAKQEQLLQIDDGSDVSLNIALAQQQELNNAHSHQVGLTLKATCFKLGIRLICKSIVN